MILNVLSYGKESEKMKNKLKKMLSTNIALKVVSLFLAFLLWLVVSNSQNAIQTKSVKVQPLSGMIFSFSSCPRPFSDLICMSIPYPDDTLCCYHIFPHTLMQENGHERYDPWTSLSGSISMHPAYSTSKKVTVTVKLLPSASYLITPS